MKKNEEIRKQIYAKKKVETHHKVEDAIKYLLKHKKSVNFNSVAQISGLSKTTLYNNEDIRTRIMAFREKEALHNSDLKLKIELSDQNKDMVIQSLKRKNKKLEEENRELKKQLEIAYKEYYKQL